MLISIQGSTNIFAIIVFNNVDSDILIDLEDKIGNYEDYYLDDLDEQYINIEDIIHPGTNAFDTSIDSSVDFSNVIETFDNNLKISDD